MFYPIKLHVTGRFSIDLYLQWEQSPTAFLERWGCDESLEGDDSDEDDDEDADDVEDQHSTGSAHCKKIKLKKKQSKTVYKYCIQRNICPVFSSPLSPSLSADKFKTV